MSDYLKSYVKPIKIENVDEYYSLIQEIFLPILVGYLQKIYLILTILI